MVNLHMRADGGSLGGAVTFGCDLSTKDPDIGRQDVGPGFSYRDLNDPGFGVSLWCSNGYVIDVFGVDREEARRVYENVFVTPSLDA